MKKLLIVLLVLTLTVCGSGCLYKAEDITRVVATKEQADLGREEELAQKVADAINERRRQQGKKAFRNDAAAGKKMMQTLLEQGKEGEVEAFRSAYGRIISKSTMWVYVSYELKVEELVQKLEKSIKKKDYRYMCVGVYRSPDRSFRVLVLLHNGS